MKQFLIISFFLSVMTSVAYADCIYDGKAYPVGTDIGGLVCQPNGTWKPRQ